MDEYEDYEDDCDCEDCELDIPIEDDYVIERVVSLLNKWKKSGDYPPYVQELTQALYPNRCK